MLLCSAGSGCSATVLTRTPSTPSTTLPSLLQVKVGAGSPFTLICGGREGEEGAPHLEGRHPVHFDHLAACRPLVDTRREVLEPAEVRLGLLAGLRVPGLGAGHHSELVPGVDR